MPNRYLFRDTLLYKGSMSSIAADGSNSTPIDLKIDGINVTAGVVRGFKVACDSTNFDFRLFTAATIREDEIEEIVKVTGINLSKVHDDFYVVFENRDSPVASKLYLHIDNKDTINPTGQIDYEVTADIHRRRT